MRMPLPRVKARGMPKASSPLLIVGLRFANPTYPGLLLLTKEGKLGTGF